MKLTHRFVRSVRISLLCSFLSSAAVLMSAVETEGSLKRVVGVVGPLIFWIGLFVEQLCIWRANRWRKAEKARLPGYCVRGLPGVCSFFKTKVGSVADITCILSVIGYLVLAIGHWGVNIAQYIFLFLIVLSFRVHCIANGKNYRYKLYLQKRRAKS